MRTTIDIDDELLAEARQALGQPTKKKTVEEALRLAVRLLRHRKVHAAFGKYRWEGSLAISRRGRGVD
jgi:Arc/MetJ family transcription regulator